MFGSRLFKFLLRGVSKFSFHALRKLPFRCFVVTFGTACTVSVCYADFIGWVGLYFSFRIFDVLYYCVRGWDFFIWVYTFRSSKFLAPYRIRKLRKVAGQKYGNSFDDCIVTIRFAIFIFYTGTFIPRRWHYGSTRVFAK